MGGELKKGDAIEVFVPDIVVEAGISPHWEHAVFERRNPAGTICALMADGKFRAFGVASVRTQTSEPAVIPDEYAGLGLAAMARAHRELERERDEAREHADWKISYEEERDLAIETRDHAIRGEIEQKHRAEKAERERDEARAALEESEHAMHMRIRAGYDATIADSWRAKVAEVERERDEAREREDEALLTATRIASQAVRDTDALARERDEARAQAAELLDAWKRFRALADKDGY